MSIQRVETHTLLQQELGRVSRTTTLKDTSKYERFEEYPGAVHALFLL